MRHLQGEEATLYLRDVLLKLGSGVVAFVMSFASGIVVARVLGAQGNGLAALIILTPTMIAALASLGIDKANGYLVGARKWDAQVLLGNSLAVALAITVFAGAVYWVAMPLTARLVLSKGIDRTILGWAFAIVPLALVEMYLQGILWGLKRIPQLSLVSVVRFASQLALNVVLVALLRLGVQGAVIAAIATPGICIVLYMVLLGNEARPRLGCHRGALKASLAFGIQGHLGSVLQFLNYRLDMFVVNYFTGATQVGFYAVAVSLAELLWYLPDAAGFVLFPKTASSQPDAAKRFTPKVARLSVFITGVAACGLLLVSRAVITTLYTARFLPSLYPLWALLPGVIALTYSKVIFSDLGGRGKPYYGSMASLLSLIVTVGLDLALIPRWGIVGAAVASSLAYMTNAALAVAFYLRLTGNTLAEVLVVQKSDIVAGMSVGRGMVLAVRQSLRG